MVRRVPPHFYDIRLTSLHSSQATKIRIPRGPFPTPCSFLLGPQMSEKVSTLVLRTSVPIFQPLDPLYHKKYMEITNNSPNSELDQQSSKYGLYIRI